MESVKNARLPSLAVFTLFTLLAGDFWRNLIGWAGFLVLVAVLATVLTVTVTRAGLWRSFSQHRIPKSLVAFLALAVVSIAWSFYPGASALGVVAQLATTVAAVFLATTLGWPALLVALGRATRWVIGLSLAFELVVAVFVRQPILPFWVDYGDGKLPRAFYWSLGELFHGGPIQGIVGNRNLLAFVAVLALVCVVLEYFSRTLKKSRTLTWLVLILATLALTRSGTAMISLVAVVVVAVIVLLVRRVAPKNRRYVVLGSGVLAALIGVAAIVFNRQLLALFGKSSDFTGRVDIWNSVSELAAQRPAFGWGWVSYWAPWVEPFTNLAERKGVTYLQAHSAWLDVQFQLGTVGLVLFIAVVLATVHRSWWFAVSHQLTATGQKQPYLAVTLLPILILAALIAQSFLESRLLIEGGWTLLVVFTLKTKLDNWATDLPLDVAVEDDDASTERVNAGTPAVARGASSPRRKRITSP